MALFKRIQSEANDDVNDEAQFSYSVMIPKIKTTLFSLVVVTYLAGLPFEWIQTLSVAPTMSWATFVCALAFAKMSASSSRLSVLSICNVLLTFYNALGVSQ
jgi:hypothetical protein